MRTRAACAALATLLARAGDFASGDGIISFLRVGLGVVIRAGFVAVAVVVVVFAVDEDMAGELAAGAARLRGWNPVSPCPAYLSSAAPRFLGESASHSGAGVFAVTSARLEGVVARRYAQIASNITMTASMTRRAREKRESLAKDPLRSPRAGNHHDAMTSPMAEYVQVCPLL